MLSVSASERAPVGLAQEPPDAELLQRRAELAEPVIDQEHLDQERRAAEDEDVAAREPVERGDARHAHHGEERAPTIAPSATELKASFKVSGTPVEELDEGLGHEGEVHQALLRPRIE